MRLSFSISKVILTLVWLSYPENADSLVEYIEHKEIKETQLVDISYISRRNISAVDVMCRAHVPSLYFQILCPVLDNEESFENNNFDKSKVDAKCKSTDNNSRGFGCSQIVRRIFSRQIGIFTNFLCFCGVKLEGVENVENMENRASLNITNHECQKNTKTVIRRKVNEEKNIRLACCISGYPPPQILWYKDELALVLPNGNTVKNNVRYLQKGGSLVISRTNVSASGSYHCVGINSAGNGRGGNYQVIFYETERHRITTSKPQSTINATYFTAPATHIEMTARATILPNFPNQTEGESAANFVRTRNETVDNKEEADDNEKKHTKHGNVFVIPGAMLACLLLFAIFVVFILKFEACKKNLSTDENIQRSGRINCTFWPEVSCFGHQKSVDTNTSIDDRDINTQEESITFSDVQEQLITCDPCLTNENRNGISTGIMEPCAFSPCNQSTSSALNVATTCDYDNSEAHGRIVRSSSSLPSPVFSIGSNTSMLLVNVLIDADQRRQESCNSSLEEVSLASCHSMSCGPFVADDESIFSAGSRTFAPINLSTSTELNVAATCDYDNDEACDNVFGRSSNLPSPDFSTDSNTSALLNKLIEIPPNADQRYFTSSLIDHNGGEVVLADTGIKLVIPEGAIDFGKTEVIYLALIGNPEYCPKSLNEDESLLAPVLMCGPHGLHFKKYVLLILPHCVAVSDEMQKTFRVLCSNTSPEMAPEWEEIFNQKDEPTKDVFCYMGEQYFSLFLLHFSWYTISGEGVQARNFSVTAYHTRSHQENEDFKVRVYFIPIIPNSSVGQQKVDESEKKLQGTLSDGQKIKIFRKDGGDIKVEATEISKGWQLIDENSIQTTGYTELCYSLEESPNRTFRFQHVDPRPERISCRFKVSQDNCEVDTPVDIIISLHFKSEEKRQELQHNRNVAALRNVSTASSSGYAGSGESTTPQFIPTRLRKDLIEILDIDNNPALNDWKILAVNLDLDQQFIKWLEGTPSRGPTERLLMRWEKDVKESPVDALRNLQSILENMEREDAASKIRNYLVSQRKETTV